MGRRSLFPLGVALALIFSAACQSRVQHGLKEREANRIVAALRQAGVEASKVKEEGRGAKFAVEVPRGQVTRAIQLLLKHDLPRRSKPGFGEVFGKASLVPTPTEQQARFLYALSGELTQTLEAAQGVLEARVHLVLPQRDPLALKEQPLELPRAAVFLRVQPGPEPISEVEVKRLVSGSVQGLSPSQVAVVIRRVRPQKPSKDAFPLGHVGPVSVTADSKALLRWLLGGGLLLILVLAGVVVLLVLRLGRSRNVGGRRPPEDDDAESTGALDGTGALYNRTR